MSLLSVAPDVVSAASSNLANLGTTLRNATAAAAKQTGQIAPPAADEISEEIATLFNTQAQEFQAVSSEVAGFHDRLVGLLDTSAAQYVSAEATNIQQLSTNTVYSPNQALLSHLVRTTGQGPTAAANPVETYLNQSLGSFGPFEAYARSTGYGGDIGIRLNTPFGSWTLISEGLTFFGSPETGSYGIIYHLGNPLLYIGAINGSQTGVIFDGLTVTFPGPPEFGGYIPNVSYQPIYF